MTLATATTSFRGVQSLVDLCIKVGHWTSRVGVSLGTPFRVPFAPLILTIRITPSTISSTYRYRTSAHVPSPYHSVRMLRPTCISSITMEPTATCSRLYRSRELVPLPCSSSPALCADEDPLTPLLAPEALVSLQKQRWPIGRPCEAPFLHAL